MVHRPAYTGTARRLVLSIDIGTTYSGMAYALLDYGEKPNITGINRYPGLEGREYKVPSILNYRQDGSIYSFGEDLHDEEETSSCRLFKLHLHSRNPHDEFKKLDIPALPLGKTVTDVFADFLGEMYTCAQKFISESEPTRVDNVDLWTEVKDSMEFVLTHPNAWKGPQQSTMRQAAVNARLVPDTPAGRKRIHFISEGEASFYHCMSNQSVCDAVKAGESVMIVDAGGGTVDISTYSVKSLLPFSVEEACASDCIEEGSAIVTIRAQTFIRDRLRDTEFESEEVLKSMFEAFDKKTKPRFRSATQPTFIPLGFVGARKVNMPDRRIRQGSLEVSGAETENLFSPSYDAILKGIRRQFGSMSSRATSTVLFVGGFSANDWLFNKLRSCLETKNGLRLYRPSEHGSKAVADGAVRYYLQDIVKSRVYNGMTFGTQVDVRFNLLDPTHRDRLEEAELGPVGIFLNDAFDTILPRGARITEGKEYSEEYRLVSMKEPLASETTQEIIAYTGDSANPRWMKDEPENFKRMCLVHADISNVAVETVLTHMGIAYTRVVKIIIGYDGSELRAQIAYTENNEEKRGEAQVIWDDSDIGSPA